MAVKAIKIPKSCFTCKKVPRKDTTAITKHICKICKNLDKSIAKKAGQSKKISNSREQLSNISLLASTSARPVAVQKAPHSALTNLGFTRISYKKHFYIIAFESLSNLLYDAVSLEHEIDAFLHHIANLI